MKQYHLEVYPLKDPLKSETRIVSGNAPGEAVTAFVLANPDWRVRAACSGDRFGAIHYQIPANQNVQKPDRKSVKQDATPPMEFFDKCISYKDDRRNFGT